MHLVVDVGNTETVMGIFQPRSLEVTSHWRYATPVSRTADELEMLVSNFLRSRDLSLGEVTRVVLGSVVPQETELLRRALAGVGKHRMYVLEGTDRLPIRLDVEEPRTVGADRIANTLAASHLFERDCIVVDLGTATTYDCISADGVFLGGVIAPGLHAGLDWLSGRTAKLPRVEVSPPDRVIGRRTEACLQSGLFHSAVAGVDGIVERIRKEWERPGALVLATGGYAEVLAPYSSSIESVTPHLTVVGLQLAGNWLSEND